MLGNEAYLQAQRAHEQAVCDAGRHERNRALLEGVRAGDRVVIRAPAGIGRNGQEWKEKTGRAVMRGPVGWVLNLGGRYGTPGIATEENVVAVGGVR